MWFSNGLPFVFRRASFLSSKFTSVSVFCFKLYGATSLKKVFLKFLTFSSNSILEEFVLKSLKAYPLIKTGVT